MLLRLMRYLPAMRGCFFLFSKPKHDSFALMVRLELKRIDFSPARLRTCLLDARECNVMAQMRRVFVDAPLAMLPSWWFTAAEAGEE